MLASVYLFFDVSGGEITVIILFILIFFGSKKIPELARGLGKGMREFQDASNSIRREIQSEANKIKDEVSKVQTQVREEVKLDQLTEDAPSTPKPLDSVAHTATPDPNPSVVTDESATNQTTNPEAAEIKSELPTTSQI